MGYLNQTKIMAAVLLTINEIMVNRNDLDNFMKNELDVDEEEVFLDKDQTLDPEREAEMKAREEDDREKEYDGLKREPEYSHAEHEPFWEFVSLKTHYHPLIREWANSLSLNQPIKFEGDPIQEFSISTFLENFVIKQADEVDEKDKLRNEEEMEEFAE